MTNYKPTTTLILFSLLAFPQPSHSQSWPQFRGSRSLGVATGANLPEKWSATENVAWKTDIPGRGWSSPIVWGNRVFVTTVVNKAESELPKKGLYFGGNRPAPPPGEHAWKLICLDPVKWQMQWERAVR